MNPYQSPLKECTDVQVDNEPDHDIMEKVPSVTEWFIASLGFCFVYTTLVIMMVIFSNV